MTRFKEIIVTPAVLPRWKEISVNTGGSAGTLQDIKVADTAGGYTYNDSALSGTVTRNRHIYWRTSNDILELVEESLDYNLSSNHVRLRFHDTPVLGGLSVHEQHGHVIILVATVTSVHRLIFPHPNRLHRAESNFAPTSDHTLLSIFADASLTSIRDQKNVYMLTSATSPPHPGHSAATCITNEGEAMFAFISNVGSVIVVKMPPFGIQGIVMQQEMCQSSVMSRIWHGFVPSVIRGGTEASDTALSLCLYSVAQVVYVFMVCRDHKIRMWSVKDQDCAMACDLLNFISYNLDPQKVLIGGAGHKLSIIQDSEVNSLRLVVYLNLQEFSQFVVVELTQDNGRYQLTHVATLHAPKDDLVDFCMTTDTLWSLWTNAEGDVVARVANIATEQTGVDNWSPILLEPPMTANIWIPPTSDPRELFVDHIFRPGKFSSNDILKTLNIFRKPLDMNMSVDSDYTTASLKQQVSAAVELEIQSAVGDYEIPEDEYYQLQVEQWSKFYSSCIQYHEVGSKAKSIFANSATGFVAIVRKSSLSYVRPCDVVEVLTQADTLSATDLLSLPNMANELQLCRDITQLCKCVYMIGQRVTDEIAAELDNALYQLSPPDVSSDNVLDAIMHGNQSNQNSYQSSTGRVRTLMSEIKLETVNIHDISRALTMILEILDLTLGDQDPLVADDSGMDIGQELSCSRLFTSDLAMNILSVCVVQSAETRFRFTQNLLLLETVLRKELEHPDIPAAVNELIPRTVDLVRSYFLLKWVSNTVATPIYTNNSELNVRQLAALDINESAAFSSQQKIGDQNVCLIDVFIRGVGGTHSRTLLAQQNPGIAETWNTALQPLVTILSQLLWPVSMNFLFAEFLMSQCQYLNIQQYTRLLSNWCQWNAASRSFMLGQCYLNFNEPYKAADCFTKAKNGLTTEDFLATKLLRLDTNDVNQLEVLYYLKVIKLFEQFGVPDVVVALATTAISIADPSDPNVATLWSKVFKHQLELGHNNEAYEAMISNPDYSRRKDCLRQLIVVLCERRELETLVQFPYIDLDDDVVAILESRARSVDLSTHNYYDLLYAFHIYRGNFRKAGSAMYEYGMRLGQELPTIKGLQRQAKCYLSALNALRLVSADYAWIPKPSYTLRSQKEQDTSRKHYLSGELKEPSTERKIELVELSDIEKEYLLLNSRLSLIQKDPDPAYASGPSSGADETVGLLLNMGLFDQAVQVCCAFDLLLTPVFEALTMRCIKLSEHSSYHMCGDNDYTSQAWAWLEENNTGPSYIAKEAASSTDVAWFLLQKYISEHGEKTGRYHRCVAIKLLSHGAVLPSWFAACCKKINAPELLRLYLDYDLLDEANQLAMEYIDAVMDTTRGQDRDMFSLKGLSQGLPQSVWLPYTALDQLLMSLNNLQSDLHYRKIKEELQKKITSYQLHIQDLQHSHMFEMR